MFRSGDLRFTATALSLFLTFASLTGALAQEDGREELDEGIALLGIFVGTDERDAVDVMFENGKFLLPAEETFRAINTRLRREDAATFLDTPIGSIEIEDGAMRDIDGVGFVSEDFLSDALSTSVTFNVEYYAIVLEPPWNGNDPLKTGGEDAPELEPDVTPPIIGMSSVHGDVFTTYSNTSDEIGISQRLEVNGHGLGGVWRLGYTGTFDEHRLSEFAWLREINDSIWTLIGRQQVGVHPLVDVVDMTGAQVAYSNRPDTFEQIEEVSGILLNRNGGSGRRFVGDGPAGGRVELVIDGLVVEESIIGVDGSYTIDSPLLGQRRSEVELRIFEPLSDNQIDTVNLTVTANTFLAPKGSLNIIAGAGIEGNLLDPETESDGATGFVRARYAPLDDLTIEAAAAFDPEKGASGAVGAAVQLGKFGTAYAGAGLRDDRAIFESQYYGAFGKTTVNARLRYSKSDKPDDDFDEREDDAHDHYAEVGYEYSARLRFGAIARHNIDTSYVLPFAAWRPLDGLSLSARPNRDGQYRLEAYAEPFKDISVQVFYEGGGFARVGYAFETEATGDAEVSLEASYREEARGAGVAVGLHGERIFGLPVGWRLRGEFDEAGVGASFGLRGELRPGVSVYVDGGMRQFESGLDEMYGSLGLSFDLGLAGGQLTPAPRAGANPREGRIAGRVEVPADFELADDDLEGAHIVVDGRSLGRVERDGSYWLSSVPKGVHSVRLEADELPIDLVIDSDTLNAEVAPGAVTPVNFKLAVEVGTAGRIIGPNGDPVKGVPLQMLNAEGEVISRSRSNQFGLFRMDGLRPGSYTLKALDIWEGASRDVKIASEYVFGTDLKVSKPSKPEPEVQAVTQP